MTSKLGFTQNSPNESNKDSLNVVPQCTVLMKHLPSKEDGAVHFPYLLHSVSAGLLAGLIPFTYS
ncbi:hypothetical protein TSUD_68950 [Trifolium subterraneum]|uniref:Uncharacterized protein n=1 Tax=Trifolium subterraneum TaxID=3900 RepID=A0A2Z6PAB5_TRISU|nr:hypothetical protein TSUD_68950 [Trifolium subterraneum]